MPRCRDAFAIPENFSDTGVNHPAITRFIDNVVPFEYQSDIGPHWGEDLGPDASQQLDGDDETRVLGYLQETCRTSWKKKA